ncbi:PAS domain S-box protein [Candidatus Sumerlaeota bacterium]|nr:PAS domain S-box protein [Candidatus Sumerlaeota bacterium]
MTEEKKKPSYEELEARLAQAEATLAALRSGDVDAFVSDRGVLLLRLKKAEEALRVSHRILEIANQQREINSLLREFVLEIKRFTGCEAVGIRLLDEDGNIPYESYMGFSRRFYELESPLSIKSDQCMCVNVIKGNVDPSQPFYTQGGSFYINATTRFLSTVSEEVRGKTRNVCNEFGYESVALVPIRLGGRILGLIHIADTLENMVPLETVEVLEEVAIQLGTAIERVQATAAVREERDKLQTLMDGLARADIGVDIIGVDYRVLFQNQVMKERFGNIVGELCYEKYMELKEPCKLCPMIKAVRNNKVVRAELKGGDGRDYEILSVPLSEPDGTLNKAINLIKDITEQKQAEESLRKEKTFSDTLVQASPTFFVAINPDGKTIMMNEAMLNALGYTIDEVVGRDYLRTFVPESDRKMLSRIFEKLVKSRKPTLNENRVLTKDGRELLVEWHGRPVLKENGELDFFFGVGIDITERKRREEEFQALRRLSQRLTVSLSIGEVGRIIAEESRKLFEHDAFFLDLVDEDAQKLIGIYYEDTPPGADQPVEVPPEDGYYYTHWLKDVISGKPKLINRDNEKSDHELIPFGFESRISRSLIFVPVRSEGRTIGLLSIQSYKPGRYGSREVTLLQAFANQCGGALARAMAEEALREREEHYRLLFHYSPVGVFHYASDLRITDCNESFAEILQGERTQLVGLELKKIKGRKIQKVLCDVFDCREGYYEGVFPLPSSSVKIMVSMHTAPIFDRKGNVVGGIGIVQDITERKLAEQELISSREQLRNLAAHLQSVREEERTNIAREIHDVLGQALTALKMDIHWLRNQLSREKESLLEKTESMANLVDNTIQTVKRISMELRPGVLDDLGLPSAIEWLAGEFQNRIGGKFELFIDKSIDVGKELSTAIFRVFQETLTNIARHANATKVKVRFNQRGGKLVLRVEDNGRGITKEQINDPKSFGLIGIRERVYPWGGEVKIKGIKGKGTTVTVTIPIQMTPKE